MYCGSARSRSSAESVAMAHEAAIAARSPAATPRGARALGQIHELLNHDLDVFGGRAWRPANVDQGEVDVLAAGSWNAGRELLFRHGRAAARRTDRVKSLERRLSGLPPQRIREPARRGREPENVRRRMVRLHRELSVLVARIAPTADVNVHLAMVLFDGGRPGRHTEYRRGIELRSVT